MANYDKRTALIVVDMQNDFADPNGSLFVPGGNQLVGIVNQEIERAQAARATGTDGKRFDSAANSSTSATNTTGKGEVGRSESVSSPSAGKGIVRRSLADKLVTDDRC